MNEEKGKNNANHHRRRNHRHHNRGKKPTDRNQAQNQKNQATEISSLPLPDFLENSPFDNGSTAKEDRRSRFGASSEGDSPDNVQIPEDYPFADDALLFPNKKREEAILDDSVEKTEIIGVRFTSTGKTYYFAPGGVKAHKGDHAIVDTARGPEFGEVTLSNRLVPTADTVQPLRPVIRVATKADIAHNEENAKKEIEAFRICNEKIAEHKLDMKLVDAQYTFDNTKLLFYFTSAGRVDFRELVKDLASVFRTRIELRQIGIRDEAKLIGGLGICGRPICCSSFLSDFGQVSIKMAKEQNLSLNSTKISGNCGRLMCCLRYEHKTYEEEIRLTPPVDAVVKTPDGVGTVCDASPLLGMIKVRLNDSDGLPKPYHRDDVKVLERHGGKKEGDSGEKTPSEK